MHSIVSLRPSAPSRVASFACLALALGLSACSTTVCGTTSDGGTATDAARVAVCGNRVCEAPETSASCPADCTTSAVCGNGVCEPPETAATCPADCTTSAVCGNGVCEPPETPAICPMDCGGACPTVAGTYSLMPALAADPSCPMGPFPVSVSQDGCTVTVTGLLPTPITFALSPAGSGTYSYAMSGASGTLTFVFTPTSFDVTDTGVNAACPGFAIRTS